MTWLCGHVLPGKQLFRCSWLVGLTLLFCACGGVNNEKWEVLVPSIPNSISLEREGETAVSYILRQTHEPLFRKTDSQNFTSRLLKSWSRNISYSEYIFCPEVSLRFQNNQAFYGDFFYSYLETVTNKYAAGSTLTRGGACVAVKFPAPKTGYLDFLTRYDNSPSVTDAAGAASGLGPFRIESVSKDRIELSRKKSVSRGYNKIVFYAYAGPEDPRLMDRRVSDFNRIPPHQQPEWIKRDFLSYSNIELTSVALGINHPDRRVRGLLYNCIDPRDFRAAFAPKKKDFLDIKTVLPVGVSGGEGGRPDQSCAAVGSSDYGPIVLANPKKDNQEQLNAFAEKFRKRTGIRMEVRHFAPETMNPMLYRTDRRPYNLIVLAVGAARTDPSEFVKLYAGKPLALDFVPDSVKKMYRQASVSDDAGDRAFLTREISQEIRSQFLALPLYQAVSVKYYPRNVKNLLVGDGFEEYPQVSELRW